MLSMCAMMSHGVTLREIGNQLICKDNYTDSCTYEVTLPSISDPVSFGIRMFSTSSVTDSLSDATYLIEWRMLTSENSTTGFSSYFNGHHFRFRDRRLQEYHASVDIQPFIPNGRIDRGVQQSVQFYELLPQAIGRKLIEMDYDSAYTYNISQSVRKGKTVIRVKGTEHTSGYEACEFDYYLDSDTYYPVFISLVNNPGQIGEQSVSVSYLKAETYEGEINMEFLTERHGEEFERYRTDGYILENLPGKPAPRLTARTLQGERYIYERGAQLNVPSIFAIMDSSVGTTQATIQAVNEALTALPFRVNVVWAFIDKRAEDVSAVLENLPTQENVLISAGSYARDTGAGHLTPVLIFVNRSGNVTDYIRGYNQDLVSLVIEKSTMCSRD